MLYPVHVVFVISRTVFTQVLSDSLIDFRYFPKIYSQGSSWLSKVWKGWEKDRSFLSWANLGQWQTVETTDETRRRQGNWFRIGFEPLFVDFTKAGAVFVIVSLLEVRLYYLSVNEIRMSSFRLSSVGFALFWLCRKCAV